jgi:DNA polymerase-3 subunit gamma/tau
MAISLYRKYRPDSFEKVQGQDEVVAILKESIKSDNVSHGYLLAGPRGTGKTTIARIFAKAVNCINFSKNNDVCNECEYCLAINKGEATDLIELDAASNRGIDDIRNIKENINFLPSFLKKKIYIIDEAHMLTKEAFNALLKTLEEPPADVMIIMATTEAHKLPVTILSRIQRFNLRLAKEEEILQKLKLILSSENINLDDEILKAVYKLSGGSYRDSETLLSKVITSYTIKGSLSVEELYNILGIVDKVDIENILELIQNKDPIKLKDYLEKLISNGKQPNVILDELSALIYERIILAVNSDTPVDGLYNLIDGILKIKGDIRYFNDKSQFFVLEMLRLVININPNKTVSVQPNVVPEKTEVKIEITSQENPQVNVTQKVEPQTSSVSALDSNLKDQLKEAIRQHSPRLSSFIASSDVINQGERVVIENKYKLNITIASKPENRKVIQEQLNNILGKNVALVLQEKTTGEESEPTPEQQSSTPAPRVETPRPEPKKNIDNSQLVEGIL